MRTLSRQLADAFSATSADLSPALVRDASRAVLDWLGSAMAGALEPPAQMVRHVVAGLGHSSEATIFAGERSSAAGAALANGVAAHMLELDDVHKGSTLHAAAPVISAAFAVAEREHASGAEFLRAVVLGYEAAFRIGEAVNPSHYRYWHPTGTAATFGAAAAASALLRLDVGQTVSALGSAGTQAAGLWEFNADGTMSKHLHPGKAAFNGIIAADLARQGFTGAASILEGERGFFRAMSAAFDPTRVTDGLGHTWKIGENCYKIWSCCAHTHSAVDIVTRMRAERRWRAVDALADIATIDVEAYGPGYDIVKQANPRTPYQAKFSLPYCVTAGLLYGGATLETFDPERFGDEGVRDPAAVALLARVTVTVADDLTAKYPRAWPARVRIVLRDGTALQGESDYPVGNPENPVSNADLEQKFMSLVAPRWGQAPASHALEAVRTLEQCSDMSTAFSDLAPARID